MSLVNIFSHGVLWISYKEFTEISVIKNTLPQNSASRVTRSGMIGLDTWRKQESPEADQKNESGRVVQIHRSAHASLSSKQEDNVKKIGHCSDNLKERHVHHRVRDAVAGMVAEK